MVVLTTLETIQDIEEMLDFNAHLVAEGEVVKVKNYYFTKTYKKVNGRLVNMILPTNNEC
jgi:hypothetical protein